VLGHLGAAAVLLQKSKEGNPELRWLAVGHLIEAERVSGYTYLRDIRNSIMDGDYVNILHVIEGILCETEK